jgi:hypothetical protein
MKKLYILAISLLATVASQAQTLKILDANGNELEQDAVVYVTTPDEEQTEEDEDNPGSFYYTFDSGLSMVGTAAGSLTVRGVIVDKNVSGINESYLSYQVCPNNSCANFANNVAENVGPYDPANHPDGVMPLDIHIANNRVPASQLVIYYQTNYYVYYTNNSDSVRRFTLVFDYDYSKAGVDNIKVDNSNAPVEYFNLNGVRVNGDLTPGLYIRRQGTKATKVVIK